MLLTDISGSRVFAVYLDMQCSPVEVRACENKTRGRGLFSQKSIPEDKIVVRDFPIATCPDLRNASYDDILTCDFCHRFVGSIQLQLNLAARVTDGLTIRDMLSEGVKESKAIDVTSKLGNLYTHPVLPELPSNSPKLTKVFVTGRLPGCVFCSAECLSKLSTLQGEFLSCLEGEEEGPQTTPMGHTRHASLACCAALWEASDEKLMKERANEINKFQSCLYWTFGPADEKGERKNVCGVVFKGLSLVLAEKKKRMENSIKNSAGSSLTIERISKLLGTVSLNALQIKIPNPVVMYCLRLQEAAEEQKNPKLKQGFIDAMERIGSLAMVAKKEAEEAEMEEDEEDVIDEIVVFHWPKKTIFKSTLFRHYEGIGLYPRISIMNHSCKPNSLITFPDSANAFAFTTRNVSKDEELCISYIGPPEGVPVVERQEILKEQYDFKCWCDQCNREVMAAAMIY
ncbi:hypothetical protein AAMO2058_001159900 [Amorphochlora amoebiformis]